MIKAVIFDMDNVIVDSEIHHLEAEKQVLEKHGITRTNEEASKYCGVKDEIMFAEYIKEHSLDVTPHEMYKEKEGLICKLLDENAQPVKGSIELLKRFKEKGMKVALASSSYEKIVDLVLTKLNIKDEFDAIVTGSDDLKSKPNPDIFLEAAKRLNTAPEECIVIEDAHNGVKAAKAASMKCIGFNFFRGTNQDLSKADIIVDDLSELIEKIDEIIK